VRTSVAGVQLATPERASSHVKVTLTSPLFQPDELAAGVREPLTCGGVVSSLITVDVDAVSPAPFVAEQVRVRPAVSTATVTGSQPVEEAMPDSGSASVQVTVTGCRCHPAAFGSDESEAVIAGGVSSDGRSQ